MNFDDNIQEVFDRYLTGQMDAAETKEFLQQLDSDPAFREAYEWHRNMVAGIREARREELKDYIKKNANIKYIGNIWGRSWVMTSAAILVIMFASYVAVEYFMNSSNNEPTAEQKSNDSNKTDSKGVNEDGIAVENEDKGKTQETPAYVENTPPNQKNNDNVIPEVKKEVDLYALTKNKQENITRIASGKSSGKLVVYYRSADALKYQYEPNKLTLYKVPFEDKVMVYEIEKASYLVWNKGYYSLKKDGKPNDLTKVTDAEALKGLPPIK
ncbi:hypothetical protein QQ054_32290 [Oscillatoria amoena NRMC-F 0135]|nr:hypothetical protein [Oscillatoria amoena NRMC-F 0135]